jgi:hypothetical protein
MKGISSEEKMRLQISCHRCVEGCFHLQYGNLALTFTEQQFRALAEVIGEIYRQIEREREGMTFYDALVM